MGFQQPPSLPDYSALLYKLNNSGVQKWNPPIFEIMQQLIAAVKQSQDVLVGTTIPAATSSSGLSSVSVDPAGALSGDGTSGSPLAVKVDGTTISIVGDQLAAIGSIIVFELTGTTPTFSGSTGVGGFTQSANQTLGTIAAIAGKVIVVLKTYVTAHQDDAGTNAIWGSTVGVEVIYNTTGSPVTASPSADCLFNGIGTHESAAINEPVAALTKATLNAFVNTDVIIRTNNVAPVTSTANKTLNNNGLFKILYAVMG